MGRKKEYLFPPWITSKPNRKEERFIQLGNSLLLHPAVLDLSDKAFRVYVNMLLEAGGKREFEYPRSKYIRIAYQSTFSGVKKELIQKGFIKEKQNNRNLRKPNIYEFIEDWKSYETP